MNNLTFGDKTFGYYETIGGGCGAGPSWDGTSGVQTHMTNTRITDPEIFERRYPVSRLCDPRYLVFWNFIFVQRIEHLVSGLWGILSFGFEVGKDGQTHITGANVFVPRDLGFLGLGVQVTGSVQTHMTNTRTTDLRERRSPGVCAVES
jgi:hypothetical protein